MGRALVTSPSNKSVDFRRATVLSLPHPWPPRSALLRRSHRRRARREKGRRGRGESATDHTCKIHEFETTEVEDGEALAAFVGADEQAALTDLPRELLAPIKKSLPRFAKLTAAFVTVTPASV